MWLYETKKHARDTNSETAATVTFFNIESHSRNIFKNTMWPPFQLDTHNIGIRFRDIAQPNYSETSMMITILHEKYSFGGKKANENLILFIKNQ